MFLSCCEKWKHFFINRWQYAVYFIWRTFVLIQSLHQSWFWNKKTMKMCHHISGIPIGSSAQDSNFSRWFYPRTHIMVAETEQRPDKTEAWRLFYQCSSSYSILLNIMSWRGNNPKLISWGNQTTNLSILRDSKKAVVSSRGGYGVKGLYFCKLHVSVSVVKSKLSRYAPHPPPPTWSTVQAVVH